MLKKEIISDERKIKLKSYVNQTISDNSLLDIGNGIIFYPAEGNLVIFDCNIYKEIKTIFISYSLIKVIKKIPEINYYLISCENGHIFILDQEFNIIYQFKPKEINNVYSLDISNQITNPNNNKIYQYLSISHYSISKEEDDYFLVHTKNALSLIQMELDIKEKKLVNAEFKKIFTKKSFNNFSFFNIVKRQNIIDLELLSFHWDEKEEKNILIIYNINENNIKNNKFSEEEKIIKEMDTEILRYKKIYYKDNDTFKIIFLCRKRNLYIFNLSSNSIDDYFKLEGSGEPGEFFIDNEKLIILIVNATGQLINISISEKVYPKIIPLNKNEINLNQIVIKDDFIRSLSWGIISIKCKNGENKILIANAAGIKIYAYKSNWIEDFFSTSILQMSGCGSCCLDKNLYCYGDLAGNLTIFNKDNNKYEQIKLEKEMIRSLCSDKDNNNVYVGTISGKIFKYDANIKFLCELKNLNYINSDNNEAITCLKYAKNNLYFSDTGGNLFIYNVKEEKIIYRFLSHEPQKDNTNDEFGSLSIKSEVWSFLVHEINNDEIYIITGSEDQSIKIWKIKLNNEKNFIKKNKLIKQIKEHKYAVTCLDWSSIRYENINKEVLLSCSDDKTINIFDSLDEKFNLIIKVDFTNCIKGFFTLTYCSFNHCEKFQEKNSNLFCIGTQAGYLIIYDISEKNIIFLEKIHYGGIEGVSFENNIISTCGNDNAFNILEINN